MKTSAAPTKPLADRRSNFFMNMRVILADDHPLIVFAVRESLSRSLGISVVADAADPKALMETLSTVECDVLVTDFSMPCSSAPDGLVMLKNIRTKFPNVRVVVLTMLENPGLAVSMRKAGVLAILNKRCDLSELPTAVIAAYQRRSHIGASFQREISNLEAHTPDDGAVNALSPREMEVVRLYVNGMTTSEVARYLHRSVNTVSTQKHSAMRKLGVGNDSELFGYALEHGLRA